MLMGENGSNRSSSVREMQDICIPDLDNTEDFIIGAVLSLAIH